MMKKYVKYLIHFVNRYTLYCYQGNSHQEIDVSLISQYIEHLYTM